MAAITSSNLKTVSPYAEMSYKELRALIDQLSMLAVEKASTEMWATPVAAPSEEEEEVKPSFERIDWIKTGQQPKMPAGTYYIGDLCYVFKDEDRSYDQIIDMVCGTEDYIKKGKYVLAWFNTGDDGCYSDSKGRCYGTDAANISIVPVDLIAPELRTNNLGTTVTFKNDFDIEYVQAGDEEYIKVEEPGNPENCFNIYIRGGPNSDDEDDEEDYDY
jgi:hypothetical protein